MNEQEFKRRTEQLALDGISLVQSLPRSDVASVIGRQLLRSVTSVGANYRASCRGRSVAEIVAKLSIVEEEADETLYGLALLTRSGVVPSARVAPLAKETDEILAMIVASKKTLKRRAGTPGFADRTNRESPIVNPEPIVNRKS